MINLPKKLTDVVGSIDGVGMAGRFSEATVPDLDFLFENATGGGLGGSVPIPLHKLGDMEMQLTSDGVTNDLTTRLGQTNVPLTLRGNAADGSTNDPVLIQARGFFQKMGFGTVGGENNTGQPTYSFQLTAFRCEIAGVTICDIDKEIRRCEIHGTDIWAGINANLGI